MERSWGGGGRRRQLFIGDRIQQGEGPVGDDRRGRLSGIPKKVCMALGDPFFSLGLLSSSESEGLHLMIPQGTFHFQP